MSVLEDFGSNTVEHLSQQAVNVFSRQYVKEVDNMFARLHGVPEPDSEEEKSYRRSDYKRVALKTSSQQHMFVSRMASYGVDVVAAPDKLNGQYLVEIPAVIPANLLQDKALKSSLENQNFADASEIIQYFQSETMTEVEEEEKQNYQDYVTDYTQGIQVYPMITNHMDVLGTTLGKIVRMGAEYEQYSTDRDDDLLNQKPNVRTEKVTPKEGETEAETRQRHGERYRPTVRTGKMKKAVVLNNNIVVIDGKIATGAVADKVLQQHQKRMKRVENVLKHPEIAGVTGKNGSTFHTEDQMHLIRNSSN